MLCNFQTVTLHVELSSPLDRCRQTHASNCDYQDAKVAFYRNFGNYKGSDVRGDKQFELHL